MELSKLIEEYLFFIDTGLGRSASTVNGYRIYLHKFLRASKELLNKEIPKAEDINEKLIANYSEWLNNAEGGNGKKIKPSTQSYHFSALRSFVEYLKDQGISTVNPETIEPIKYPRSTVKYISVFDVNTLLESIDRSSVIGLRDYAIIELLYSGGLRASEIALLDRNTFNHRGRSIVIPSNRSKQLECAKKLYYWGDDYSMDDEKRRLICIGKEASDIINDYLLARKDYYKPLFLNERAERKVSTVCSASKPSKENTEKIVVGGANSVTGGNRVSSRTVERLVEKYAKKAGLNMQVTPIMLKQSYEKDLLAFRTDPRTLLLS